MYLILRTLFCMHYECGNMLITHLGGQYSVSRLAALGWGWCTEKGWARGRATSSEVSRPGRTILTPAALLSLPGEPLVSHYS